jgi:predicted membrane protein
MKIKFSNLIWGTFLLLAAAFILINQLNGFTNIGIGSIIAAILSLAFFVQCIADLNSSLLPIPLAVLYIIFRTPLDLPNVQTWTLILSSVLASIGLAVLLPHRHRHHEFKCHGKSGDYSPQISTENSDNDNNPTVSVNFGAVSRHLCASSLETARLYCNFGAIEIFFDQVELNPNGAEVVINCSFGAVKLYLPKNWRIIDKLNCSLGGVDMDKRFSAPEENAPQLTLTGSVSLGGIEVRYL